MFRTFDSMKRQPLVGAIILNEAQRNALRNCLVEMLRDIVHFCNENGISYALCGGSALGAVREHGMIPWDDDIDICMPRKDYERFIEIFEKQFGSKYSVQKPGKTPGYPLLLAKVRKKGTRYKTRDDFGNAECGVSVDLFIVENTYNGFLKRSLHGVGCLWYGMLLSCRKFYRDRKELLQVIPKHTPLLRKAVLKIAMGAVVAVFADTDRIAAKAERMNGRCRDNSTKYVTTPAGRFCFFRETFKREDYCRYRNEEYEKMPVSIPLRVEKYFDRCYGVWQTTNDEYASENHAVFEFEVRGSM